jgi:hypothetical protein
MNRLRALTLTQPWAGLVAAGIKLVENRPRAMIKRDAIGARFAIHASREIDQAVYDRIRELAPELRTGSHPDVAPWYRLSRITSAVIAVATLDGIVDPRACGIDRDDHDAALGVAADQRRWFFGPICYVLCDVVALRDPVPCRGWQGFWSLPADIDARVHAQFPEAA